MLVARIVCSDPECLEEIEIAVNRLEQLDGFTCECGYGFVLASVSHIRNPGRADVVAIETRRGAQIPGDRRQAA